MAKILLIVAIVVSAATAVLGFMNQSSFKETKQALEETEGSLKTAKTSLADTTKKLTDAETQLTTLEADKEQLSSEITAANEAATKAKADATAAASQVAEQKNQIEDLNAEVERLNGLVANAGPGQPVPQQDDGRTAELEAMVAKLEQDLTAAKAEKEVYVQKETERKKTIMKQGLEGQVLAVNPAWNFVVLSIGDRQGVVNNAELLLKRGNEFLGKVRVTSVEPSTSIADIVANSLPAGVSVQPGDSVIYQAPAAE